jgi:transmembrane sensor
MPKEENYTNLIIKHLTDELSPSETDELERWLQASDKNLALSDDYRKLWQKAENQMPVEIQSIDTDAEWRAFERKVLKPGKRKSDAGKKILRTALTAAASILIVWALIFFFKDTKVTVLAESEVKEAALPDNSKVMVNVGSKIEYPENFIKNRTVELSGEAYFIAEYDVDNPFTVRTPDYDVVVTGTEFFVSTVGAFEVIVNEGSVKIQSRKQAADTLILKSNERAMPNKEQALTKAPNESQNFLAWKTGKLVFDNDQLSEIVAVLERTYNVRIEISKPEKGQLYMTVSIDNQSIESVMTVIEATLDVSITKTDDKYIIF